MLANVIQMKSEHLIHMKVKSEHLIHMKVKSERLLCRRRTLICDASKCDTDEV